MVYKKNKGSALIVVLMVMAVMTILGVSILNISLSQTKQAALSARKNNDNISKSSEHLIITRDSDITVGKKRKIWTV